ncbi:hypothetical protein Tco_0706054 [Tanacetum coccineum]|uniref:Uncharacterized protein n=1 Tax=Tanacetum coccineum TaxID=301880 RepID=A0ABQ4Y6B5_9ASTR
MNSRRKMKINKMMIQWEENKKMKKMRNLVQQQSSSISSDLVAKFINPSPDTSINSLLNQNVAVSITPSSDTTIPQLLILIIQPQQQTYVSITTTTISTTTLPEIPNFASLFKFECRVSSLEIELSEFKQTNQFAEALSSISRIVDNYLTSKMKDEVNVALQLKFDKLREEAQAKNQDFLNSLDSNMKRIIKEQVKAKTSKIMTKVEKYVTETLGAKVLVRSTNQPQTSYAVASSLSKFELKKILMDKIEENKSIDRSDVQKNLYRVLLEAYNSDKYLLSSYGVVVTLKRGRKEESLRETTQKASKSTRSSKGVTRSPSKSSAKSNQEEEHELRVADLEEPLHQEFDTGNDVSPVRELNIQNLTQDLLTGPTYDLIKGTCKSVVELDYHLEEVFKATNDQLDWHTPEGRPYPHDLSKPLPLILDARGCQIIPYDHFINNDLEYLKGGSSSRKYTTSITKTKDADYERVEDLQLAVESYQKKINLTKPNTYRSDISKKTPYTAYRDIEGIIYQDDMDRNRLMRTDELYKFSDGTLNHVCTSLNDIATRIQIEQEVDAKSRKVCWWKTLQRRPSATTKDHMILSYDVLIIQVDPHGFEGNLKMVVKVPVFR